MRNLTRAGLATGLILTLAVPASAQERPAPAIEGGVGYHGKVDEAFDNFLAVHGGARVFVTSRVALGPEITWLRGSRNDRDWIVTGNVTIDLLESSGRRVVPYAIAGAGWATMQTEVGTGAYRSSEFALTAGGGVRFALGRRVYIAPEVRTGWETHLRYGVTVGLRTK
jgi:hypothetical protein